MKTLDISCDAAGVARVTMARPEVFNAFNEAMIADLDAAFAELGEDPSVRVIVLSGAGKAFSAGADLQWMQRAAEASVEKNLIDARGLAAMYWRIDSCRKPTIARVQGAALGGGVGLTCVCDIALASEAASFALSEAKLGILPAVIGPYVINAVGKRHARRLALSAHRIGAQEALGMGLVHKVVPAEELDASVDKEVQLLLANGPQALGEIKSLFGQLSAGPVTAEVCELTAQTISRVRATDEAREGFSAFLDKRPARWIRS